MHGGLCHHICVLAMPPGRIGPLYLSAGPQSLEDTPPTAHPPEISEKRKKREGRKEERKEGRKGGRKEDGQLSEGTLVVLCRHRRRLLGRRARWKLLSSPPARPVGVATPRGPRVRVCSAHAPGEDRS